MRKSLLALSCLALGMVIVLAANASFALPNFARKY